MNSGRICPDSDTLTRLLGGQISSTESEQILNHLEGCSQCARTLSGMKDEDTWLDTLRSGPPTPMPNPERVSKVIEQFISRVLSESAAAGNDQAASPEVTRQPAHNDSSFPIPESIGRYRIQRLLGRGGFGLVYLAHDGQLQRFVAVKVPHRRLVDRPEDAEAYLTEARTVANLDHPSIVPVHDVGSTEGFPCYIVSKFIDGNDLASRLKQSCFSISETVELVATVANALHYAHKQGLVHRDVKPGNILLDKNGKPFVTDFGMALREQDSGKGARYAGTPAYMSPEQARGEGHRVDGRSDIFSLGVVLYELLTGRRPFGADSQEELLEQVSSVDARPPRQVDDAIPKELERICLKALAKRASERYTTAKDFAEDLRHFLSESSLSSKSTVAGQLRGEAEAATPIPVPNTTSTSSGQTIKVVPKGLRSFDAHDADFFLELLPGPRDREGLPDSIRFWKTRVEEMDSDNTFSVGLVYGPSGCGKSSLVKAGLLPRLSDAAIAVYVEATAEETEIRLLNSLRKRCPALPENVGLKETLAALRRGKGVPVDKKVVIVLDQFEQWLHAKKEEENTELAEALRQCDGSRLQCIVMVRDDFWMAATRFMRDLEIRLLEGQNSAAVDLLPIRHAEKVLAAFGRAFGDWPDASTDANKEQKQFLEQSVPSLAQEGKVVCVRLALFAEMMKGKSWTPASLKAVGGAEGVGVTFLEGTFSAATAPPEHRYHQKAARAVLKAFLPEIGSDIKGHMRSYAELLEASGYGSRPKDFDDLIHILDSEIRLITPTDPEGKEEASALSSQPGQKYYQLTHDYLVPSLRDWLTRKQKETRPGRAELLLADRAGVWNARPENRQLPSLLQWFSIRWLTMKKNWTQPQRKMMRKAGRYHAVRGTFLVVLLAVATITGLEIRDQVVDRRNATKNAADAAGLVQALLNSEIAQVPGIVLKIEKYRYWTDPLLREENAHPGNDTQKLRIGLALLPVDPDQREYLYSRLLEATPGELLVIRDALAPHKDALLDNLWAVVERSEKVKESQRLRAAAALAQYDANSQKWDQSCGKVVEDLVSVNPDDRRLWSEAFRSVKSKLRPQLSEIFRDHKPERTAERSLASNILADYAADQPETLAVLICDADDRQFAVLLPVIAKHQEKATELLRIEVAKMPPHDEPPADASVKDWKPIWSEAQQEEFAKKRAGAALALLRLGDAETVWPLLKGSAYPEARSRLIHRFVATGVDSNILLERLHVEKDASIRQALILALGEYGEPEIPTELRRVWVPRLLEWYQTDPDAGVHSAIDWLLRHEKEGPNPRPLAWGQRTKLSEIDTAFAEKFRAAGVAAVAGQMMRVVVGPIVPEFSGATSWTSLAVRAPKDRSWFVNSQGQTFAVIDSHESFLMGSPVSDEGREFEETLHWRRIGRKYALQTKAVTGDDFQRFLKANTEIVHPFTEQYSPEPDGPILTVSWYVAAQYCRWLSEQEGIPEDQMVYPSISAIEKCKPDKEGAALVLPKDHLQRTGYRLPTEAEWEYACRSGTLTSRAYGSSLELLPRYAWYLQNAQNPSWPVGQKRPNERGYFDLHGNTWTWCQESKSEYKVGSRNAPTVDLEDRQSIADKLRVLRGSSFYYQASVVRSSLRYGILPSARLSNVGFRLARTFIP